MKGVNDSTFTDQSLKTRRPKSREVGSRFLSPKATPSSDTPIQSPKQARSPHPHRAGTKPSTTPPDTRKHRSLDQDSSSSISSGSIRGLWPSSTTSSSSPSNKNLGTSLADHLGNERLKDYLDHKKLSGNNNIFSLGRQRSCSEFNRLKNEKEKQSAKENHRPILGGSMRYTGKFKFSGKSSSSSSSSLSGSGNFIPGRLSFDENALYSKSNQRPRDSFLDNLESESERSHKYSTTDCNSPGISTKVSSKSGIEVPSKYMQDIYNVSTRPKRMNSDSDIQNTLSLDRSPRMKMSTIKDAITKDNSLTGYARATSQWALSPGRSGSPPMSVESKQRPMSFSSLRPPNSTSRVKGVEKLLNLGLDLFKSKKSSSSPMRWGDVETVHQLRLLHNRLFQWRFANARADAVNGNITNQVEIYETIILDNRIGMPRTWHISWEVLKLRLMDVFNTLPQIFQNILLCAGGSLKKLQDSVIHKKLQLEKEKLQMRLYSVLESQLKPLESWGDMERQHQAAVSMTKESLHSVVCRVPVVEGAKLDSQAAAIALRHASDVAASIKSMLASFSPSAEETVLLLSELAKTVAHEKLLMEEFLELSRTVAMLEVRERSLKCYIIQLISWQKLQQLQEKQDEEISS